uniref:uncharacterized protein LOC120343061 n=1 Tax=Styela clava TaxID=7725 RepID=UPI001939D635|nr:uncharacterized protein LOC120343061 [Styela clava]
MRQWHEVNEVYPHSVSVSGKEILAKNKKIPNEKIHEFPETPNDLKVYEKLDYSVEPLLISQTKLKGSTQKLKVTLRMDENGILDITPSGVMYNSDWNELNIEQLIDENRKFDENDIKMQLQDEVRNNLETLIYGQIQNIPCLELSKTHKNKISEKCNDMLEWIENHRDEEEEVYTNKKNEIFRLIKECEEEKKARDKLKKYIEHVRNAVKTKKYDFNSDDSTMLIDLCTNGEEVLRNLDSSHVKLHSTFESIWNVFSEVLKQLEEKNKNSSIKHNANSTKIGGDKNLLSEYVKYVKIDIENSELKLEPADKKLIKGKCDKTETWIKQNPEAKQKTLEEERNELKTYYETVFKPSIKKRLEVPKKTTANSLAKYVDDIIKIMSGTGAKFEKKEKDAIFQKCRSIQEFLKLYKVHLYIYISHENA